MVFDVNLTRGAQGARPTGVATDGLVFVNTLIRGVQGARPTGVATVGVVFDLNLLDAPTPAPIVRGPKPSEAIRAENASVDGKHAALLPKMLRKGTQEG